MKKYLLPLGVAALLLSGCSGESPEPESSAKDASATSAPSETSTDAGVDAMGPGAYTFETGTGAVGTLQLPGEPPADIEELRTMAGAEAVTYVTGNLDNREGSEPFDAYAIKVYDPEGNEYTHQPAGDYVSDIRPGDAPAEIYNRYIDLGNSLTEVFDPLERGDFVMVGPELPAEIAGVSVSNGLEDFGAQPAG